MHEKQTDKKQTYNRLQENHVTQKTPPAYKEKTHTSIAYYANTVKSLKY